MGTLYNSPVSAPSSSSRLRSADIVALRALAERQPELAPAAELQIELIETTRRVHGRLSTPWIETSREDLAARLESGLALVDFAQIAFEWTDVRLLVRQITEVLRRHDAIDEASATAIQEIGRHGDLPGLVRDWFAGKAHVPPIDMLSEVLTWATRPYLQRTAEVIQQRVTFHAWGRGTCPVCAAEPEFAILRANSERQLVCGRCHVRWTFDGNACPYCGNADRSAMTSFATPDGTYRVVGCGVCRRYVKALDMRRANRALMPLVDPIATLPLDAAVMQRGFKATAS